MSKTEQSEWQGMVGELTRFFRDYYRDEIGWLAERYPRDSRSLEIDWSDLHQALPDFATDLKANPHGGDTRRDPLSELHDGLYNVDIPLPEDFQRNDWPDAHVRVKLPQSERLGIGELRSRHRNTYVAVHGQIERVTAQTERMTHGLYECTKCGKTIEKIQPVDQQEEPGSCPGTCSGKPNWELDVENSKTIDVRKVKLKQPPEEADGDGKTLRVYLEDDLAFTEGDRTMPGMAGERATIHGILKRDLSPMRGRNGKPEFGTYIEGHAIEFENSLTQDIEIQEYKDQITEIANAQDTLNQLVESFAPHVAGEQRMYQIKRAAVLYLFGGYRKDLGGGESQRGDIHMLLVGDPATGKSQVLNFIEAVSPRCERLSGTDSTGVGLTASANQSEFGDSDWVLKPGLLPRASGGHAIVDELDKMGDTDNLHEALEDQRVHVAKAGMKATLKTETGLIAAANPEMGRFGSFTDFVEQIDIEPALFSRFDIIHTLHDKQDKNRDEKIAKATLSSWKRASEGETTSTDVPIDTDTFRAYIAHAKDIDPTMTEAAMDRIIEWYVDERADDWDDVDEEDDTVPITARSVPGAARLAEAHARAKLREKVIVDDVEVAIQCITDMIGDVFLNDEGQRDADLVENPAKSAIKDRRDKIVEKCGGEVLTVSEIADEVNIDRDTVEQTLHSLNGEVERVAGKNRWQINEVN